MFKIGIIGSVCIDNIILPDENKIFKNWGGIVYLLTALSAIFKENALLYPVTKIEKKYYKKFLKFLNKYKNIALDYVYLEPEKTNIVKLIYNKNHTERKEISILKSTPITFNQIKPILNLVDILIISYISGYDISLKTLQKIRNSYDRQIYCDIHSFILTKTSGKIRKYKNIKNPENWLRNFDIIQGNLIEWEVVLKNLLPSKNFDILNRSYYEQMLNKIFSLGVKKIIVTLGKDGVIGAEKNRIYKIKPEKVKRIIDTTGCGDTLTAGVIYGLFNFNNFKKSLQIGNKFASLKSQKRGFFKYNENLLKFIC